MQETRSRKLEFKHSGSMWGYGDMHDILLLYGDTGRWLDRSPEATTLNV